MSNSERRDFLASLKHGIDASAIRENNLNIIFETLINVKEDIEKFSEKKISLKWRDSQRHTMLKAAALASTFDPSLSVLQKPTSQVIYIFSTINETLREDLTVLELGTEGFPCSVTIDGNRFTSADIESFQDSLDQLLSSPSTGEKIKKLLKFDPDHITSLDSPE
ncbi:hypothetical protein [Acinetobacter sp. LMB-5]|uniref:hypothetical protein n=1 Tax=Acinetobacter sp. LMB-5 TaxID=1609919 RepID=UPI00076135BD|nr:hypothetical protein [Acinetobacter sp. LMB-5]OBA12093.1 hypothetical protein A9988_09755 [Acinetobacter calcoaceticus]